MAKRFWNTFLFPRAFVWSLQLTRNTDSLTQPSPPPADQVLVEVHNLSKMCIKKGHGGGGGGEGGQLEPVL